MPKKIYVVELTAEEREYLNNLVSKGKVAAYKRRHAQILLKVSSDTLKPATAGRVKTGQCCWVM